MGNRISTMDISQMHNMTGGGMWPTILCPHLSEINSYLFITHLAVYRLYTFIASRNPKRSSGYDKSILWS
uniref:Transposon protein n=1 Tax=Arundo donax TaxID=35708 RepID=A0A0A9CWW0_ARUDO